MSSSISTSKEASEKLALSGFAKSLGSMVDKLESGEFRFLIIGDFNRGKSTILNALFKQELLPMGVTATTAIPTFVKYGDQKEVIIHKEDGATEKLSLTEYRKNYTLNSKSVKEKLKKFYNEISEWLDPLDHAEFIFPLDALYGGIEFIDTAGLNHTDAEDEKTFAYVPSCHAILFVLSAEQQITKKEQDYLEKFLRKKKEVEDLEKKTQITLQDEVDTDIQKEHLTRPIFYLINKWEKIDNHDRQEIHEAFAERFSECLDLSLEKVEQMWGESIFDVYAKTALSKVVKGEDFSGTGLDLFEKQLNHFLINKRLITEITQAVESARNVSSQVAEKVGDTLKLMSEDLESLEKKIDKAKPHIEVMKKIVQLLQEKVDDSRETCVHKVSSEYNNYFSELIVKFERDFTFPSANGLRDVQREEYTEQLQLKLSQYRQQQIDNWHEISKGIVLGHLSTLKDFFQDEISEYQSKREEIREILNGKTFDSGERIQVSSHENTSPDEVSLTTAQAGAMTKMIVGATGGLLGTATAGIGAATAANVYAGTHILLAAGLTLTPIGWALLGASALTGGALAWWQKRNEIEKFQQSMQKKVKQEFEKILDKSNVVSVEEKVSAVFEQFSHVVQHMNNDVSALEGSLNNLLISKKSSDINLEEEALKLGKLKSDISSQLNEIESRYESISLSMLN
ncbi:MAG: hypothetical protein F6J87_26890 [Spirulina sp. SIO3F2]|nr:hypothetical protein [Spirulina sp. SIO3F2]